MASKLKVGIIVQARIGSTRMPGKVLEKVYNKSILEIIYLRLKKSNYIKNIKFAIPKIKSEKNLKKHLLQKKIPFFEGSTNDVLDRYYKCAKINKYDHIVRVTGDCPLIDASLIDQMYSIFKKKKIRLYLQ